VLEERRGMMVEAEAEEEKALWRQLEQTQGITRLGIVLEGGGWRLLHLA